MFPIYIYIFTQGNITNCASTLDAYINFNLSSIRVQFSTSFELPQDPPSGDERHKYVKSFAFGITDVEVLGSHYDEYGTSY
jgi:hypothetical protein